MSVNRYGRWALALGTLAIGLVAGSLLGPRLLGDGGSQAAPAAAAAQAPPSPSTTGPAVHPTPPEGVPPPANVGSPAPPPGSTPEEAREPQAPAPPAAPEVAQEGPSATPSPLPPLPEIQAPSDDRDERRWRERTAGVRDRLVAAYESCLAHSQAPYKYLFDDGRVVQIIDASAFAAAKAELLTARSALQFLQEDARRAGVLPGWVRVDWSGYPRDPTPETGACERALPEELQPR